MSAIFDLVRECIERRRVIAATYQGHRRLLCPHAVGYTNGEERAIFYQTGGSSASRLGHAGSSANWRCIPLNGLSDVAVTDGQWGIGKEHRQRQSCVQQVVVRSST